MFRDDEGGMAFPWPLKFETVRCGFDLRRSRIVAVRIRILSECRRDFVDRLEIHPEPHDGLLNLRHGQTALATAAVQLRLLEVLQSLVEFFAELLGFCHVLWHRLSLF